MSSVILPYTAVENDQEIGERILYQKEHRLVPTIRFQEKDFPSLSSWMLVLNDEEKVKRALNLEKQKKLFHLHGIPNNRFKIIREYLLLVFQTQVLVIYRTQSSAIATTKTKPRYERVKIMDTSKEVHKVKNLAIRMMYALGLDYGVVKIGVGVGNKVVAILANPFPRVNKEMIQAMVPAIKDYVQLCSNPKVPLEKIVLGADPEFIMQDGKGELLIASNYFPIRGKVGCDAIWLGNNHANKPLVELRPSPTPDPRTLSIRIYQALLYASKRMGNMEMKWLAGALPVKGFPLGGHIHFSGVKPNFKLLRALDNYLALPLILAEDPKGKERRPKYGFLGDFRRQPYGGFEYRTLPSWLVSPTITRGVFALSKIIVTNYAILKVSPLSEEAIEEAYYQGDKEKVRPWLSILWQELKQCEEYGVYQKYLDDLYQYLQSGKQWSESQDFRKWWRLPPYNRKKS